jgi:hypothetical protein
LPLWLGYKSWLWSETVLLSGQIGPGIILPPNPVDQPLDKILKRFGFGAGGLTEGWSIHSEVDFLAGHYSPHLAEVEETGLDLLEFGTRYCFGKAAGHRWPTYMNPEHYFGDHEVLWHNDHLWFVSFRSEVRARLGPGASQSVEVPSLIRL